MSWSTLHNNFFTSSEYSNSMLWKCWTKIPFCILCFCESNILWNSCKQIFSLFVCGKSFQETPEKIHFSSTRNIWSSFIPTRNFLSAFQLIYYFDIQREQHKINITSNHITIHCYLTLFFLLKSTFYKYLHSFIF